MNWCLFLVASWILEGIFANMADALVEQLVTQWLPDASIEFLAERCTEYNIQIDAGKADDATYHRKRILRHLTSDALEQSADQGVGVWRKIFGELGSHLGKGAVKPDPDPIVVPEPLTSSKLREFKVTGSVDGGKEGTLQYVSLLSQLSLGESARYTTPELIYGVVRACPPASAFRTLLESNLGIEMDEFQSLLKSHFGIQDSDSILVQLKALYQGPSQSAHDFCCKAISLRNQLKKVAEEEGQPWGDDRLKRRLVRTISTGLKQNGIKFELMPYLTEDCALSDFEFLDKVAQADIHELERLGKVEAKETEIKLLSAKTGGKNTQSSPPAKSSKNAVAASGDKLLASVNALTAKIDNLSKNSAEQAARLAQMEQFFGGQISALGAPGNQNAGPGLNNSGNNPPRRVFKCSNCITNNIGYCNHCFKCKQAGHRRGDPNCPEN